MMISGPAPAPLLKAESYYRYQIMLRSKHIVKLSQILARIAQEFKLPEAIKLIIDIDPVNLS